MTGINSVLSGLAEGLGLTCPDGGKKINADQWITKVVLPDIRTYALMDTEERESKCMRSTSGPWQGCYYYYTGGSVACRMSTVHAQQQCDQIMIKFRQMVLNYQPIIVKDAIISCEKVGDGCIKDNVEPLVIDAYGKDAFVNCFSQGIKPLASPCKPKEQPCCQQVPLTPAIKCKKARAEAASRVGNLGSQIGQGFNNPQTTDADAQMIADRQACQQAIMGNALKYLQDAACDAASKTPADDFSGIWPAVLQAAKDMGLGEAYTKCDGPYNRKVKINGCRNKCAQPATLKALYNKIDAGAEMQCNSDCVSGAIVGRMPTPGLEDAKQWQQDSCMNQCIPLCETLGPTSAALCKQCKDACSSSSGTGSGGSGKTKQKLGSDSGGLVK